MLSQQPGEDYGWERTDFQALAMKEECWRMECRSCGMRKVKEPTSRLVVKRAGFQLQERKVLNKAV